MTQPDATSFLKEREGGVELRVRVQPKASRNAIAEEEGRVRVALTAPPVEGAANEALCAYLADRLGVAKRCVRLMKGDKSREKTVFIMGLGAEQVRVLLGLSD